MDVDLFHRQRDPRNASGTEVEKHFVVSPAAALVCEGMMCNCRLRSWTNFQWSGPNGFSSTSANLVIKQHYL